jgi:4-aminobutyrate aminotransferase-like enzyme
VSLNRPAGTRRSYDPLDDLVWDRAAGCHVWDSHGNRYVDLISGYSATNLGHGCERLLQVASNQLREIHFANGGNSTVRHELEHQLVELFKSTRTVDSVRSNHLPNDCGIKVWLSTTGARAIEIAWKLVYCARPGRLLRFDLGFHGRSISTSLVSDTERTIPLAVAESMPLVIPFPRCSGECGAHCQSCSDSLEKCHRLVCERSAEISALLIEPAIGARGYFFAPAEYFRRLVAMVRDAGILVISDEIQMGLGRMGSMIVAHANGCEADLVVVGKSLGGGIMPMSAVVGSSALMDAMPQGRESETYAATPLGCRIASEVLRILDEDRLAERANVLGERFRAWLRHTDDSQWTILGRGLASVIDFGQANLKRGNETPSKIAWQVTSELRQRGVLVHLTGPDRDRIAMIPPLNIDESCLFEAADIICRCWHDGILQGARD